MAKAKKRQEEEPEEEYEVERVESHKVNYKGKQKKPELMYLIKWKNYPSTDNTWESSVAVDNAEDLVDEYWETKGGQQQREDILQEIDGSKQKSTASVKKESGVGASKSSRPAKKRKQVEPVVEEDSDGYAPYSSEEEPDYSESDIEEENFRENSNWKDVAKVESVRTGDDKKTLYAIVKWNDGKVARYQTSVVSKKNPMALIQYYEKRLSFEKNT